ncbi:MAG TPA: septation protein IspZ [Rhizomicrobium sp.]|jgi:intracellular septation protein A|nr:septation protein IspZ [Rhizomicrobium sp.]
MLQFLKVFKPIVSDFLSTILFIVFLEITQNVVLSTSVGIATGVIQFLWFRYRGQTIELMQYMSVALVIVLGAATIYTKNAHFMMLKPSIAGFAIACVMARPGWQNRYLPAPVKENLSRGFLVAWGYAWCVLYFALAMANLYFAEERSQQAWETFTAFVPTAAPFGLFFLQYVSMRAMVFRTIRGKMAAASPAE